MPEYPDETKRRLQGKPEWLIDGAVWLNSQQLFGLYLGKTYKTYRVKLDEGTPALPLSQSNCGSQLYDAAVSYALNTGDFAVQLQELVDGGYIPFKQPVAGLDPGAYICGQPNAQRLINAGEWHELKDPQYQVRQKNDTLKFFLCEYGKPAQGAPASQPRLSSLMELEPNPQFWVNPFTGQPMQEAFTDGDYVMVESGTLSRFSEYMLCGNLPAGQAIPYIIANEWMVPNLQANGVLVLSADAEHPARESGANALAGQQNNQNKVTFSFN